MYLLSLNMYFLIILKLQNLIVENDYKFRKKSYQETELFTSFLSLSFIFLSPTLFLFIHSCISLFCTKAKNIFILLKDQE